jgi:hypothetical protein
MGRVSEHANRWAGLMAVQIHPQTGDRLPYDSILVGSVKVGSAKDGSILVGSAKVGFVLQFSDVLKYHNHFCLRLSRCKFLVAPFFFHNGRVQELSFLQIVIKVPCSRGCVQIAFMYKVCTNWGSDSFGLFWGLKKRPSSLPKLE